jgi:hypothetical protein
MKCTCAAGPRSAPQCPAGPCRTLPCHALQAPQIFARLPRQVVHELAAGRMLVSNSLGSQCPIHTSRGGHTPNPHSCGMQGDTAAPAREIHAGRYPLPLLSRIGARHGSFAAAENDELLQLPGKAEAGTHLAGEVGVDDQRGGQHLWWGGRRGRGRLHGGRGRGWLGSHRGALVEVAALVHAICKQHAQQQHMRLSTASLASRQEAAQFLDLGP